MSKTEKYVEIKIHEAKKWGIYEYLAFLFDSLYQNIFPFVIGFFFCKYKDLKIIMLIIMPIYFKFKFSKEFSKEKTKKIKIK